MTIIQLPENLAIAKQTWGQKRLDVAMESIFGAQAIEAAHPLWEMSLSPSNDLDKDAGAFQALMLMLRGHANLLACHNLRRPVPLGTMRGAMALASSASAGAYALSISASGQGGATLKQGDYLGIGSGATQQVVMAVGYAVANGSGAISVTIEPPLRNAFSSGALVVWDKPKALFRRKESGSSWDYEKTLVSGMSMSFIEDWRI